MRNVKRKTLAWDSAIFTGSSVDTAGAIATTLGLFDPVTLWGGNGVFNRIKVRRVIFRGGLVPTVQSAALTQNPTNIISAVVVSEEDDTDTTALSSTAAGTLLADNRVLGFNSHPVNAVENVGSVFMTPDSSMVRIDYDWSGSLWLKPSEIILLHIQLQSSVASSWSSIAANGMSRVLFEVP